MKKEQNTQTKKENKAQKRNRADRFTWNSGDLRFFASKEEFEKQCEKEGRKVVWY